MVTFYFKDGRKGSMEPLISFECEEYRHRGDSENFHFEVWVEQGTQFSGGCVMVKIHARNLRDPVRHRLPVAQSITYADTLEAARAALGLPPAATHAD